mmetsp:Transcript_52346/g.87447  ORF Transcript_52346/g.87447 Transcript_52346/m.87447 type:complete len:102 (+) Transcript_52346:258-563(+)|eukprot:CAMPEP_0174321820 /NCGR_PEP_ID=MMETSP0810-20121108/10585_1 /TAXON_ID=73025 ORGANISM="Eutreptiella gymnastica-like, Strain CCMP1594" /NCGR_SAMPLE_ID=MMETSP0810 /ASSEMBLY_ACC=CAM_ASM_000659 /LENGTH=101 /DNA_ID=CAMNT_0015433421 /DNA_START=253 /DNA_END=558 /DNA_ORIENTATION=-
MLLQTASDILLQGTNREVRAWRLKVTCICWGDPQNVLHHRMCKSRTSDPPATGCCGAMCERLRVQTVGSVLWAREGVSQSTVVQGHEGAALQQHPQVCNMF